MNVVQSTSDGGSFCTGDSGRGVFERIVNSFTDPPKKASESALFSGSPSATDGAGNSTTGAGAVHKRNKRRSSCNSAALVIFLLFENVREAAGGFPCMKRAQYWNGF